MVRCNQRIQQQAEELLAEMTLEQKLAQIQCLQLGRGTLEDSMKKFPNGIGEVVAFGGKGTAAENVKTAKEIQKTAKQYSKIPPIMHAEAVTGLNAAEAAVFPSAIGLGATWNPDTVEEMADVIRKQMLAVGVRQALSPVMDVARDQRWGRVGETYGEDPTLCARMSVAFTKGLQGNDLKDGIAATGKHFLGYGMGEGGLNMAANPIPPRELREVYAKPFQAAITEAGLESVMNSYGSIDGELVIESENILNHLLREEMHFDGIVVSDYMSIDKAVDLKVSKNAVEGGKRALTAGLDIELPSVFGYTDGLLQAIENGELSEELLDRAVKRVLMTKIKLGLLDNPGPREELLEEAYYSERPRKVSLKAAREAIVLLKNDGLLPLEKKEQKIAVIGPHGDCMRLLFGCYTYPATLDMFLSGSMHEDMAGMEKADQGERQAAADTQFYPGSRVRRASEKVEELLRRIYGEQTPVILQAIREKCPMAEVEYESGCDVAGNDRSRFEAAVKLAEKSDVVILCLGGKYGWGSNCTTGEGVDTDRIGLPGVQEELVKAICETQKPTVLVHMDAKPLSSEYASEHCQAIIENWFPGITGGQALADVLFGAYNPAGRLPMTAARTSGQIPIYASHRRGSGYSKVMGMTLCKYVEGTKQPLYYLGEGMSYTSFAYSNLQVTPKTDHLGSVKISCEVENTGEWDGEEVVQLYITDESSSMLRPNQELAGFARIALKKGQKKTVEFTVRADQFAFLDKEMRWMTEAGTMLVKVGASSEDIRLSGEFEITDTAYVEGYCRGFYAGVSVTE